MRNQLAFSVENSYRDVSLEYLGCVWEFESHLSIEDLFHLQNLVESTQIANQIEEDQIKMNIMDATSDVVVSSKRLSYQKRIVIFVEEKLKENSLFMTNRVFDKNKVEITQEFFKERSYEKHPFFVGLFCLLAISLTQWAERQSLELKKK